MWKITRKVFISVNCLLNARNAQVNFAEKPQMKTVYLNKNINI